MTHLLRTLVLGLVAREAIQASGYSDLTGRANPIIGDDVELTDSILRELGELMGRPLTQQEVELVARETGTWDQRGQWSSWPDQAERLTSALQAADRASVSAAAEERVLAAEQATQAAQAEVESLKKRLNDQLLVEHELSRQVALNGYPTKLAYQSVEDSLWFEAETLRIEVSRNAKPYRTQRAANQAIIRADALQEAAIRMAQIRNPGAKRVVPQVA